MTILLCKLPKILHLNQEVPWTSAKVTTISCRDPPSESRRIRQPKSAERRLLLMIIMHKSKKTKI